MTKHTPGPLEARRGTDGNVGIIATDEHPRTLPTIGGALIAEFYCDIRRANERAHDEAMANAQRMVACWHACRTLTTEQVEQIDGLLPAKLAYQIMQRDRELLLGLAREMAAFTKSAMKDAHDDQEWLIESVWEERHAKCVNAIAKVTGSLP